MKSLLYLIKDLCTQFSFISQALAGELDSMLGEYYFFTSFCGLPRFFMGSTLHGLPRFLLAFLGRSSPLRIWFTSGTALGLKN